MKSVLITMVITGFSMALASCGSKNPNETAPKKIEVTGSSEIEVVPDEIYINFTLREYLNTSKTKVKLEDIKSAFLSQCKAAGIADSNIYISGYAGYERWNYYYYKRRKSEPEFMNAISYTVKTNSAEKFDRLVPTLDEKALENFNISKTSYSKMEELRRQVKQNALAAAKNKAKYLAAAIGENIGEALFIQEIDNDASGDVYNRGLYSNSSSEMSDFRSTGTSPDFEKIKIRYEMKAEFSLK